MIHEGVSGLLHGALGHSAPQMRTASEVGITVLTPFVSLLLAMSSYHFFKSPILRFGHRFRYSPKARDDTLLQAVSNAA
jgi:peptidoglycan/LPS O-acetylase OafA/YrhL